MSSQGIDWAVANRARYNIRVINLSLGHPVDESASTDPLCLAVQRAVNAGVVVVVAAGNQGRAPILARELGGITSPGNSPDASRLAPSTRGARRSRRRHRCRLQLARAHSLRFCDEAGRRGAGIGIVSLEAAKASLISRYPFLHRAGSGSNAYMQLSGTSMAAPMVSGAAALLLQGVPGLSPGQIKLALQSGATYMKDGGLVGGGAGSVNVWTSRVITANGLTSRLTSVISALGLNLGDPGRAARRSGIAVHFRAACTATRHSPACPVDLSRIWSNPSLLNTGDLNLVGLTNPLAQIKPNPMMYGGLSAGMDDGDQIIWGTTVHDENGQDVVWGTDDDDQIIWGTNEDPPSPRPARSSRMTRRALSWYVRLSLRPAAQLRWTRSSARISRRPV